MSEDLLQEALDTASRSGARFTDARLFLHNRLEYLSIRNGTPEVLSTGDEPGFGIRVLGRGGWGFASTTRLDRTSIRETAEWAVRLSRRTGMADAEVPFALENDLPHGGTYETRVREDPFAVPLEEKIRIISEAEAALHVAPEVKSGKAEMTVWHEEKLYASSEGASYRSAITHVGGGISAVAHTQGESQRRSYPNSFGGDFAQGGFEFIRGLDLPRQAGRVGKDAVALLSAPTAPSGTMDLVLSSDQLSLQVHESVGHATELDRVFGYEAGFAGTSFVRPGDIRKVRYGSPVMNIVADATVPGAMGSFGWDDEGVPARRVDIVRNGILSGFLSSREMAARQGLPSSGGTVRGDGPLRMPIIRMTNVNLLPGDHGRDELISEVKDGIYMETNVSWSIDDKRLNFQFGTEVGRRIEHGELTTLVRNPIYSGITPEFWGSLEALGNKDTYHVWGLPNCGKGQPTQTMRVAHGAPLGLFRHVRIGGTGG